MAKIAVDGSVNSLFVLETLRLGLKDTNSYPLKEEGTVVYDKVDKGLYFSDGITWVPLEAGGAPVSTTTVNSSTWINAGTEYRLGGTRLIDVVATDNLLVGQGIGTPVGASNNTITGQSASASITSGSNNTINGRGAASALTTGSNHVIIGADAGKGIIAQAGNVFVGYKSGQTATATNAVFVGFETGIAATGANNSVFGYQAGKDLADGTDNAFFGTNAGKANVSGLFNCYFGSGAGLISENAAGNVYIGYEAGAQNNSFGSNTFIGYQAGKSNNSYSNVFIGELAGDGANGTNNVGIGNSCLNGAGGGSNVAIGQQAGWKNQGNNNTFVGTACCIANPHTGNNNTITGASTATVLSSGSSNCIYGYQAGGGITGVALTTGSNNVLIGKDANVSANAAAKRIVIGTSAVGTVDNSCTIGDSTVNKLIMGGGLQDAVNDAAAAALSVPVGGLYHTSGAVKIRLV